MAAQRETRITGLVLAGGRASRMQGRDKGLLPLRGRALASQALQRLRPQVDALLLSANRNLEAYRELGVAVCSDAAPQDFRGPLAGIAAALARCATPWLLVVPCDCPYFPTDLAARLLQAAAASGAEIAYARAGGRMQPVFCLLRRELLPPLQDWIGGGEARVGAWIATRRAVAVDFADAAAFANLNTPAELQDAEALPDRAGSDAAPTPSRG